MSGWVPGAAVQLAARGSAAGGWLWFACRCIKADGGRATEIWKGGVSPALATFAERRQKLKANYLLHKQLVRAVVSWSTASLVCATVNVSTAERPPWQEGMQVGPQNPLGCI